MDDLNWASWDGRDGLAEMLGWVSWNNELVWVSRVWKAGFGEFGLESRAALGVVW